MTSRKDEIILQQMEVIRSMAENNLKRMESDFWGSPKPAAPAAEKKPTTNTPASEKPAESAAADREQLPPPEKIEDLVKELEGYIGLEGVKQEVKNLKGGKYNYSISIMGGDGGATEIYAYVKINGEIVYKQSTEITVYDEWHTATISGIDYNEGDEITVGIYVKCAGPNAWGKIDDATLNAAKG